MVNVARVVSVHGLEQVMNSHAPLSVSIFVVENFIDLVEQLFLLSYGLLFNDDLVTTMFLCLLVILDLDLVL